MRISFVCYGSPRAWKRPKHFYHQKTGKAWAWNPSEKDQGNFLAQCIQYKPDKPISTAIKVSLTFYLPIPSSLSKKKRLKAISGEILPITKPELDNLEKMIYDALESIFYIRDSQIVWVQTRKFYGEVPRTEMMIETMGGE